MTPQALTPHYLDRVSPEALRGFRATIDAVLDSRARQWDLFSPPVLPDTETGVAATAPAKPLNADLAGGLSPSQVRCYLDCSGRWWYHYGLGLPDRTNANLSLGRAVHSALGENFAQKVETKLDLPTTGVIGIFRNAWAEQQGETTWKADDDPAELGRSGEALVTKYMDEAAPRIEPAKVELEVSGTIGGVLVRGKIIDIKTAARKPSGVDPLYRSQATTYTQITPGATGECSVHTLVKTKAPQLVEQSFHVEPKDRTWVDTVYPHAQAGMRSGYYMPNRASMLCSRNNCVYWERCEADYGGQVRG